MKANEYQNLAMRTNDGNCSIRLLKSLANKVCDVGSLICGCLGLAGESGEFSGMIKKWIFHEKELDIEHLKKECGDVLWYIALICDSMNWNMEDVMELNIDKLKKRYPEGFDVNRANNREGD